MAYRNRFRGDASADHIHVLTQDGKKGEPSHSIFPIVTQDRNGIFSAIGTGTFIAGNGICVTAAHVVEAVVDDDGNATGPLGLIQFGEGHTYYIRPILRAARHPISDVAVGVPAEMTHNDTGEKLRSRVARLTSRVPEVGKPILTYAYPETEIRKGERQEIHFNARFVDGYVKEWLESGRDRVLLPGSCCRTSMVIHGGCSGGPVVGPDGMLFAVNSSSIGEERVSYVSWVESIKDISLDQVQLEAGSEPEAVTVGELARKGQIAFE